MLFFLFSPCAIFHFLPFCHFGPNHPNFIHPYVCVTSSCIKCSSFKVYSPNGTPSPALLLSIYVDLEVSQEQSRGDCDVLHLQTHNPQRTARESWTGQQMETIVKAGWGVERGSSAARRGESWECPRVCEGYTCFCVCAGMCCVCVCALAPLCLRGRCWGGEAAVRGMAV